MSRTITFEIVYDNEFWDIVPDDRVLMGAPIVITRGQGDESIALRPQAVTARIDNRDDSYRISNPESPLYGRAAVNMLVAVTVDDDVRGLVEASSWRVAETPSFRRYPPRGSAWVDFEGGGLLRRINQSSAQTASAFRYFNDRFVSITEYAVAYFPCEQDRADTELAAALPGSRKLTFEGATFGSRTRPPSSAPVLEIADGGQVSYELPEPRPSAGSGYQFSWVQHLEPLAPDEQRIMSWTTAGPLVTWTLFLDSTLGEIILIAERYSDSVQIINASKSYGSYDWSDWTLFSVDAQESGGTATVWVNWKNSADTANNFLVALYSGSPTAPQTFSFRGGAGELPAGSALGHFMVTDTQSLAGVDLFSNTRSAAWFSHIGETAGERFVRILFEQGHNSEIVGTLSDTMPMGPQQIDTLPGHLAEIRATEDCLIYDAVNIFRPTLRTRASRVNQTPKVALRVTDLAVKPPEVSDDLPVHNIITVTQRDGVSAYATDTTSPMGTGTPPNGRGEYEQRVDVNVDDVATLQGLAYYWLNRGTVDAPRFPAVTVDLHELDAATRAAVESVNVGDVITLDDVLPETTLRLHVLGLTETIEWPTRRRIVFNCAPDDCFNVGTLDLTLLAPRETTLKAAMSASDTAATFRSADLGDAWNQTTPYDVLIAGQLCRVTAMGAPALVSGAYDQAATLVRGTNGVRKSLAAASLITVPDPLRCTL